MHLPDRTPRPPLRALRSPRRTAGTAVIGAGQAGLAVSRCLTDLDHDHVVIDRGRVAERWRSERWDSLRLLSPNWMTRLPGFTYDGPDPDGFMTAAETVRFFQRYATSFDAPVKEHAAVSDLRHDGDRFVVSTTDGAVAAHNVVLATGWCDRATVPAGAEGLSRRVHQIVPAAYRNPDQLLPGGVLVVGASASGVQIAHELAVAGRRVVLAVGRHQRLPRRYRGMDIFWWLDRLGAFDRTVDEVDDVWAARAEPALQLVGRPDRLTLDLAALQDAGVVLTGRFEGAAGTRVHLGDDLPATVGQADVRLRRLLERIDAGIAADGLSDEVLDPDPIRPVRLERAPASIDLAAAGISTVVWATGYRRHHPWLRLPVIDARGEIRQRRGITPFPGAYVVGQRFQHFRSSSFIDGVGRDAEHVARHIVARSIATRPLRPTTYTRGH